MSTAVDSERSGLGVLAHPLGSATQAARALQTGGVSAQDLLATLLARIERVNPTLNAIVTLDVEQARARAQAADEARARGETWGPLHGVPITVKDAFETAGLRTVSGYPPLRANVPRQDAPAVARLRDAGAIIVGKTNLPTLASGIQTTNPVFGRTNNPWDLARTPGGSSGGAAAAVAAGLSFLDLGSDIGGSIRIPAHFCGVYGLKLTGGRIPGKGHIASPRPLAVPAGWEALLQLGAFGPLARSVHDMRLGYTVLTGAGPASPQATGRLRVAWTMDFGGAPLSAETAALIRQFVQALGQAGCQIEERAPGGLDFHAAWYGAGTCLGAINTLFQTTFTRSLRRLGAPALARFGPRDPLMQGLFAGMSLRGPTIAEALRRREDLIAQLEGFLMDYNVWVCPVFPGPAFTHRPPSAPIDIDGRQVSQLVANLLHSIIFNVSGNPVVTIPIGQTVAGLPVGVQLVGRRSEELALLAAAERIAGGGRRLSAAARGCVRQL